MNLTQVSYYARTAIKIFFGLAIIYVLALVFKNPIKAGLTQLIPPKDPPNPVYGQLPPLEFIAQPIAGTIQTFELNTPNGKLPADLPKKMTVYKYIPNFLSFEAGKTAQETALSLGFAPSELISDYKADKYIWRDINYNSLLAIDLLTQTVNQNTPLSGISSNYALGSITKEQALGKSQALLQKIGKYSDPLYLQGTQNVVLGRYIGNKVVEVSTPLEAQLAKIDYFRSLNDVPILGPNPKEGLIHLIVGTPSSGNQKLGNPVVYAFDWEIDTVSDATYPIIPVTLAWQNVAEGNGVIANTTDGDQSPFEQSQKTPVEKVFIENIYLAYYDSNKPQEFMQPIYVFEGRYTTSVGEKGSITVYYPAIDGKFIKGSQESPEGESKQQDPGSTDTQTPPTN